jgi:hypothetical protein
MLTSTTEDGGFHLRWSAIIGGGVVTLGVWILLHTLGMAIGLTAVDPHNPASVKGAGIGTGIWSVIVPLIALFVGGWVAARTAGPLTRTTGIIHGAVVWGLTTIAGVFIVTAVLSSAVRTGFKLGGAAMTSDAGAGVAEALGLGADDLLSPVNPRLEQRGVPPLTPQQLEQIGNDLKSGGLQEGHVDRQALADSLSRNTDLPPDVVAQLTNELALDAQSRAAQAKQQVQTGALKAADALGKAMWGVFFGLLLGLVSAVAGAIAGTSRRQRAAAEGLDRGDLVPVATTAPVRPVVPEPTMP